MADLHTANEHFRIWALSTQEMLWDGFTGARKGSAGISAFPSLHVASSVLLAIYATHCRSRFAPLAWLFAAAILLDLSFSAGTTRSTVMPVRCSPGWCGDCPVGTS